MAHRALAVDDVARARRDLSVVFAFFCVSGLDLLNALEAIADQRQAVCDWVYALQVLPAEGTPSAPVEGFRGGSSLGARFDPHGSVQPRLPRAPVCVMPAPF